MFLTYQFDLAWRWPFINISKDLLRATGDPMTQDRHYSIEGHIRSVCNITDLSHAHVLWINKVEPLWRLEELDTAFSLLSAEILFLNTILRQNLSRDWISNLRLILASRRMLLPWWLTFTLRFINEWIVFHPLKGDRTNKKVTAHTTK